MQAEAGVRVCPAVSLGHERVEGTRRQAMNITAHGVISCCPTTTTATTIPR